LMLWTIDALDQVAHQLDSSQRVPFTVDLARRGSTLRVFQ